MLTLAGAEGFVVVSGLILVVAAIGLAVEIYRTARLIDGLPAA